MLKLVAAKERCEELTRVHKVDVQPLRAMGVVALAQLRVAEHLQKQGWGVCKGRCSDLQESAAAGMWGVHSCLTP